MLLGAAAGLGAWFASRAGAIGQLLGETVFGPLSNIVTGALEGGLFAACVVGAMALARERISES